MSSLENKLEHKILRSHPINVVEYTSRYLILLALPLLRALLTLILTKGSLYAWLKGAWFDILIVLGMIGMGMLAWYRYTFSFSEKGITVRKGILLIRERFLPYQKISVISVERPWFLLPFRAVRLNMDTDGGLPTTPDFQITIHRRELEPLLHQSNRPFINYGEIKRVYLPKNIYIALLSFISSNTITGVVFVATFVSGAGKVLGQNLEEQMMNRLTSLAKLLAFGAPPAAALLAMVILGGWLVSFLMTLMRHLRFSATRQSQSLKIEGGLFTRREYFITVGRINQIELRQSLLTHFFGFYSAFIYANGYGKKKDELSVLMPAAGKQEMSQNLHLLLPEIPFCPVTVRPQLKYLSRFLIPPIGWILAVTAIWVLSYLLFTPVQDLILYVGLMAEVPCVWYLLVKICSYLHTGVGVEKDTYTFAYTYGYHIKTIAVPKKRIVRLQIRQSLFQVISGCCDLVILTFSEGNVRHVVPNLNFEEAKKIMEAEGYYHKEKWSLKSLWSRKH